MSKGVVIVQLFVLQLLTTKEQQTSITELEKMELLLLQSKAFVEKNIYLDVFFNGKAFNIGVEGYCVSNILKCQHIPSIVKVYFNNNTHTHSLEVNSGSLSEKCKHWVKPFIPR